MSTLGGPTSAGDTDRSALLAGVVGVGCLVGAFVGFLLGWAFTPVLVLGVLLAVAYGWYAHQARTAKAVTLVATLATVLVMGLIVIYLFREAIPVARHMGLDLLTRTADPLWSASGDQIYSLVPLMWGTLVTTLLAIAVVAPLGVAGALFISEVAPGWLRAVLKPGIELLAGVPTIVYGFIGFTIINPYFFETLELSTGGTLFAGGLVIGVIALPTVVSVAEDALSSVPESMKSGSLALGSTDWQTMRGVTLPAAFSGVSAAVLLGVGRAVGETMAVTVMLGNTVSLPDPLYDIFGNTITLTTAIASQYGVASGLHESALFAAGVVLFLTVLVLSVGSQLVERRMQRSLGGQR